MRTKSFLDSIKLSLEYQYAHAKKEELANGRHFITISRQPGAGALSVGKKLADYLNAEKINKWPTPWKVFERELVNTIVMEHHLPKKCAMYMPEKKMSAIQEILDDVFGLHPPALSLVHKTNETILHLAHLGNAIIVGRGGSVITRKLQGGFHVRLVGSLYKRIGQVMKFCKVSEKEAKKIITKKEEGRRNYLKGYFNKDIDDPLLYDLILNTDHLSYDDTARIIAYSALCCPLKFNAFLPSTDIFKN